MKSAVFAATQVTHAKLYEIRGGCYEHKTKRQAGIYSGRASIRLHYGHRWLGDRRRADLDHRDVGLVSEMTNFELGFIAGAAICILLGIITGKDGRILFATGMVIALVIGVVQVMKLVDFSSAALWIAAGAIALVGAWLVR